MHSPSQTSTIHSYPGPFSLLAWHPNLFLKRLHGINPSLPIIIILIIIIQKTYSCHRWAGGTWNPRKGDKNVRTSEWKGWRKRGIEGQTVKLLTPTQAIDAFIGEEQEERNRELSSNPATLDHSVTSCDSQVSYGEPIFFYPQPTRVYIYLFIS